MSSHSSDSNNPPAASLSGSVISSDGVPINYQVQGSGTPTLFFVHCWSGDQTYWKAQVSHFSPHYRVVTLDLAGHGNSGLNWIFTGDHVIDGSTVVIDPPDGNMLDYLASLAKVKALRPAALAPGHGDLIHDPDRALDWIVDHRLQREAKVVAALHDNPGLTPMELVPYVYKDVDESLYAWAERSLLAHLIKLQEELKAAQAGGVWSPTR